ncbi:ATP-binding cassette domain-containing protein (plasmid) [Rhizobium ruizarguesonis]|uniref:ATP-binding cassette domain-containing protein n=1 Tax=Rhizobium ruizarguesonis TaxID=2081791 RepID=UPI00102FD362|nr:ATP-binding cassette domain-containing protein [Rhizobium ruizarguesonis]TBB16182.1 ATP-binding cassette domain-containing protein [Rhizobium ruizarguesonis]
MTTTITQSQDLMSSPVLNVRGLRKTYGGVVALKGVDFDLMPGEIHGLCGENGAGKSTLVKILGGLVAPTEGEITVDGAAFKGRTDPRLISIVHQELSIIPDLSVLDNVLLGDQSIGEFLFRGRYRAAIRRQLDDIGLSHVDLDQPARELGLAEQQPIEIAPGGQYASVLQSPIDDGAYAAQAVADVLDGKTVEKTRFLPHEIITKDNVKDCYPANGK